MRIDLNFSMTLEGSLPVSRHITLDGDKLKGMDLDKIKMVLKAYGETLIDETLKKLGVEKKEVKEK